MHISGANQNLWVSMVYLLCTTCIQSELCKLNTDIAFCKKLIDVYLSVVALFLNDRILNLLVTHVFICEGIHIAVQ